MNLSFFHSRCPLVSAGFSTEKQKIPGLPGGLKMTRGLRVGTDAATVAVAGAVRLGGSGEEKGKRASAERLWGADTTAPHICLMYRLIDHSPQTTSQPPANNPTAEGYSPETKIVCRGDIFPTFCACTPFLVRFEDFSIQNSSYVLLKHRQQQQQQR